MSGNLKPGVYFLRLAADPSPLVGVNVPGLQVQPVVTMGEWRTWVVTQGDDGTYTLMVQGPAGNPVTRDQDMMVLASGGPSTAWIINGPEGGPYTIQAPGDLLPPSVWTVDTPDQPGSPVRLLPLQLDPTPENQKWYFVEPQ